jgi:hypothetical protein
MKVSHFPSFMEGRGKHTQQNTQSSDRGLLSGERDQSACGNAVLNPLLCSSIQANKKILYPSKLGITFFTKYRMKSGTYGFNEA